MSTSGDAHQQQQQEASNTWTRRVFRWRVIAGISAPIVLLSGVGLITVFILQESWTNVLTTSLLFFSGFQLFYWYLRAKTLFNTRRQLRAGLVTSIEAPEPDDPPPYDEVMKTEAPPPAYYTIVSEGWKHVPSPVPRSYSTFSLPGASTSATSSSSSSSEKEKSPKSAHSYSCIPVHKAPSQRPSQPPSDAPAGIQVTSQSQVDLSAGRQQAVTGSQSTGNLSAPRPHHSVDPIRTAIVRALDAQTRQTQCLCRGQQTPAPVHRVSEAETRRQ